MSDHALRECFQKRSRFEPWFAGSEPAAFSRDTVPKYGLPLHVSVALEGVKSPVRSGILVRDSAAELTEGLHI
jgi:hypothetical protein